MPSSTSIRKSKVTIGTLARTGSLLECPRASKQFGSNLSSGCDGLGTAIFSASGKSERSERLFAFG